jgi:hypothetical protein
MTMNYLFTCKIPTFAFGIAGIVMMSLAPASATTVVRDHREAPVVRDHRDIPPPVVRDHRDGSTGGGVVVKDSPAKSKTVHIKYKNPACLGPFCL